MSGYEITNKIEQADICEINTCSVTNVSDRKSRQTIRKVKEKNNKAIIIVTGCYAQVAQEDIKQMPEVDLIIGNNEKKDVIEYLEKFIKENNKQLVDVKDVFDPKEFADFGTIWM